MEARSLSRCDRRTDVFEPGVKCLSALEFQLKTEARAPQPDMIFVSNTAAKC